MRKILAFLFLLMVSLTGCNNCDSTEILPVTASKFQLFDVSGNNLWWGNGAPYSADSAQVYVRQGNSVLPLTVTVTSGSGNNKYVSFTLPLSLTNTSTAVMLLNEIDSLTFDYMHSELETNCQQYYELAYITQNGEIVCNRCGISEADGGSGEIIKIYKN